MNILVSSLPLYPFRATRLSPTTFMINEFDDVYDESPFVYVKVVQTSKTVIVIDTGCGAVTRNPDTQIISLRKFIETVPLQENRNRPLNEGGDMQYVVVITHCHYDHIRASAPYSS